MPPMRETFAYDADGNLLRDGQWDYAYDAENRLVSMQTKDALLPVLAAKPGGERPLKITFTYDYLNRRASKKVQEMVAGIWQDRHHHLYVYNGSSLIAEIDAISRKILRTFAYGATGELLMIHDRTDIPQTYLPVHDAAGSVTGILRASDNTLAARYEYDPNGVLLRAQGDYAKKNPFTHGAAWMDWETGLVNNGPGYYSPRLGRMINATPSGPGDGIMACYGVAPAASYLPPRQYGQPPARQISIDYRDGLAAYEAALSTNSSLQDDIYILVQMPDSISFVIYENDI